MSTHLKIHLKIGTQVSCIKCMMMRPPLIIEIQIDFKVDYLNK